MSSEHRIADHERHGQTWMAVVVHVEDGRELVHYVPAHQPQAFVRERNRDANAER